MAGRNRRKRNKRRRSTERAPISGKVAALTCIAMLTPVAGLAFLTYHDWTEDHHVHIDLGLVTFALGFVVVAAWSVIQWWRTRGR